MHFMPTPEKRVNFLKRVETSFLRLLKVLRSFWTATHISRHPFLHTIKKFSVLPADARAVIDTRIASRGAFSSSSFILTFFWRTAVWTAEKNAKWVPTFLYAEPSQPKEWEQRHGGLKINFSTPFSTLCEGKEFWSLIFTTLWPYINNDGICLCKASFQFEVCWELRKIKAIK